MATTTLSRARGYAAWALVLAVLATGAWASFTTPRTLVLDSTCRPEGPLATYRSRVQGREFWAGQLFQLDTTVEHLLAMPARMVAARARAESLVAPIRVQTERFLDSLSAEHAELHPRAKPASQQLREQADHLEELETQAMIDSLTRDRAMRLMRCRPAVVAQAGR